MARGLLCLAATWMAAFCALMLGGPSSAVSATWSGMEYSVALTGPVVGFLTLFLFFPGIIIAISGGDMPPLIVSLPFAAVIVAAVYAGLARSMPIETMTLAWRGGSFSGSLASGAASMVAFAYLIAFLVALSRGNLRLSSATGRMRGHTR
ncbi:hypothetical protein [Enterovirga rhinocerotis]|uniref:Uncharacterized protein n=1 Tax=Enterovirga rhinocerotis TaxID=1339210 RepID=A0A4R7BVL7_9HYPH|nr:hypothetical protein [Enterovirga rhinocerotis]TDR89571.1 hypothetical protein EV668_2403 [Enterovirga rhinocerotis]